MCDVCKCGIFCIQNPHNHCCQMIFSVSEYTKKDVTSLGAGFVKNSRISAGTEFR